MPFHPKLFYVPWYPFPEGITDVGRSRAWIPLPMGCCGIRDGREDHREQEQAGRGMGDAAGPAWDGEGLLLSFPLKISHFSPWITEVPV